MQQRAAALQLLEDVVRGKALIRVRIGEQDDNRAVELAQLLRGIEDRLDDPAAVGRLCPDAEPENPREPFDISGVVDQPYRLPDDMFNRECARPSS